MMSGTHGVYSLSQTLFTDILYPCQGHHGFGNASLGTH